MIVKYIRLEEIPGVQSLRHVSQRQPFFSNARSEINREKSSLTPIQTQTSCARLSRQSCISFQIMLMLQFYLK